MFCKKCGMQMATDGMFCARCGESCGADNRQLQSHQGNYENKLERNSSHGCGFENTTEFYTNMGWEILGISEDTGMYLNLHIKMQRNKNMQNYGQIKELSDVAESYLTDSENQGVKIFNARRKTIGMTVWAAILLWVSVILAAMPFTINSNVIVVWIVLSIIAFIPSIIFWTCGLGLFNRRKRKRARYLAKALEYNKKVKELINNG